MFVFMSCSKRQRNIEVFGLLADLQWKDGYVTRAYGPCPSPCLARGSRDDH